VGARSVWLDGDLLGTQEEGTAGRTWVGTGGPSRQLRAPEGDNRLDVPKLGLMANARPPLRLCPNPTQASAREGRWEAKAQTWQGTAPGPAAIRLPFAPDREPGSVLLAAQQSRPPC
jgi:hypothetical protein